jgi:hypothetical protein
MVYPPLLHSFGCTGPSHQALLQWPCHQPSGTLLEQLPRHRAEALRLDVRAAVLPASAWCSISRACGKTQCEDCLSHPKSGPGGKKIWWKRRMRDSMGLPSKNRWISCFKHDSSVNLSWMSLEWPTGQSVCHLGGRQWKTPLLRRLIIII